TSSRWPRAPACASSRGSRTSPSTGSSTARPRCEPRSRPPSRSASRATSSGTPTSATPPTPWTPSPGTDSDSEYLAHLGGGDLVELGVGAGFGGAVGAEANQAAAVAEATGEHVLVAHLGHQLDPQRFPRQVLLGVPAADPAGHLAARL